MKKIYTIFFAIIIFIIGVKNAQASDTFTYNLQIGMKNDIQVILLQNLLINQGYLTGINTATGNFGPLTFSAVKAYQSKNNISPIGIVGPLTRKSLNSLINSSSGLATPQNQIQAPSITFMPIEILSIADTNVNLNVSYKGQDFKYTTIWIEYGISEASLIEGNGTKVGQISLFGGNNTLASRILGLLPETKYYVRAAGMDDTQKITYSTITTFTTTKLASILNISPNQPSVITQYAGNISSNGATLLGSYDSKGSVTTVWFEYWTINNSNHTETPHSQVGASSNVFSTSIVNLSSAKRYYFRIVAQNIFGTSYGEINSFLTN